MNHDARLLNEKLEEYDYLVSSRFWVRPRESMHEMGFKEWRDFILSSFGDVSDAYAKKVYEDVVFDKELGGNTLVQLRLCDVFNKVDGTCFEMPLRRAIMRCVYSNRRFDREIKPVMDAFYADQEE